MCDLFRINENTKSRKVDYVIFLYSGEREKIIKRNISVFMHHQAGNMTPLQ